ncbi:MAG: FecR family protein [Candidatus Andeanibacterium colombiense]|uniref:FecR family protein n=1 Tax=Candidatus Andeanibacterium colombiense TaxID=3121345 RepID=A0AAJ6BLL8_9SPHN|nr:MAG: FecR family protein [Sphingomonadaceae bacterium]
MASSTMGPGSGPKDMGADLRDQQARAWLARLHGGRASADDRAAHARWRADDAANEAAWTRAERTWVMLGALGGSAAEFERAHGRPKPGTARRAAFVAGLAAVLCLGAVWSYRPYPVAGLFADAATAPGERRSFALDDGSRVTLTGSSVVDFEMDGGHRGATLIEGEALFEVAHDPAHPFVVRAGDARVMVTGTRFTVRRTAAGATLMLAQGSVNAASAAGGAALAIRPGGRVDWAGGRMAAGQVPLRDIAAWQRGRLIFRSRPLSEVLETLSLYRGGRIYAPGAAGSLRVTGVIDVARPDLFLAGLPESLPVQVTRFGPITIIRAK